MVYKKRVLDQLPNVFVSCAAYSLNLVVNDVTKVNLEMNFFSTVETAFTIFFQDRLKDGEF